MSDDKRDAERYRFLRAQWVNEGGKAAVVKPESLRLGTQTYSGELLDELLDEAMRQEVQGEGLLRPLDSRSSRGEAPMTDPKRAEPNEHSITEALRVLRLAQDICRDYGVEDHIYRIEGAAAELERLAARVSELEEEISMHEWGRPDGPKEAT